KTPASVTQNLSLSSEVDDFDTALTDLGNLQPAIDTSGFDLSAYTETVGSDTVWKEDPNGVKKALSELTELVSQQATDGLDFSYKDHQTNQRGLDTIDVTTQEGAWVALKKIDNAIDQINGARATLGAMQTRFETAVSNIDIQVENLSAARGRIMDADFAVETANLSRTQILQQAGTAMVAQANQIPQNVLQLLQG
ncbi:MAG: flagellin, partial [Comamonas sp.]